MEECECLRDCIRVCIVCVSGFALIKVCLGMHVCAELFLAAGVHQGLCPCRCVGAFSDDSRLLCAVGLSPGAPIELNGSESIWRQCESDYREMNGPHCCLKMD